MNRTSRVLVPILALLALVAVVIGVPVALVIFVGSPIPSPAPSMAELGDILAGRSPIPASYLISILAIAMWAIWVQVAWAVVVETAAALRGKLAERARLVPGVQLGVAKLVTTATLLLTSSLAVRPAAAGPLVPVAMEQTVDPQVTPAPQHRSLERVAASVGARTSAGATMQSEQVTASPYMTEPGDTWWGIAEDHLGSGTKWKEIRALNLGRTMADGSVISANTDLLKPQWRLLLPAKTTVAQTGRVESARSVVVERGDTIWGIAEEDLDDRTPAVVAEHVADIADMNSAQLNGNPDLIFPGQQLDLPSADGESVTQESVAQESASGETASSTPPSTTPSTLGSTSTVAPRAEEPTISEAPSTTAVEEVAVAPVPTEANNGPIPQPIDGSPPIPPTSLAVPTTAAPTTAAPTTAAPTTAAPTTAAPTTAAPTTAAPTTAAPTTAAPTTAAPTTAAPTTAAPTTAAPTTAAPTTAVPSTAVPTTAEVASADDDDVEAKSDTGTESASLAGATAESAGLTITPGPSVTEASTAADAEQQAEISESLGNQASVGANFSDAEIRNSYEDGQLGSTSVQGGLDDPILQVPNSPRVELDVLADVGSDSDSGSFQSLPQEQLTEAELLASQSAGLGDELDTTSSRAPVFLGLAALTLIGGSLYRARGRRRSAALRHRHPGRRPTPPKRRTRAVARRLAAAAEPEHPEFVNIGLRALGRQLQSVRPEQLPKISGVWVSHDRLVIALADDSPPSVAPPPFTEFADGSGWSLHRSDFEEAASVARGANGPLPLLTTVGTTTALDLALTTNSRAPAEAYGLASSLLFAVDLEAGRVISIEADDEASTIEALTMMALELATSETADQVEIVCVGFGHRLATFERVTVIEDLTDVLGDLETVTSRAVYAAADASPFATRVGNGAADTWNPVVVFHADSFDPHSQTLVELASRTAGGVTAVCGYPTQTGWTFKVRGDRVSCSDLPGDLANHDFKRPELQGIELIPDLFDEPWGEEDLDEAFWKPMDPVEQAHTWHLLDSDEASWRPMGSVTEPEKAPQPATPPGEASKSFAMVVNLDDVEPTQDPEELWESLVTGDPESWPEAGVPEITSLQHSTEHRPLIDVSFDEEIDEMFDGDHLKDESLTDDGPSGARHLHVVEPAAPVQAVDERSASVEAVDESTVQISILGDFTINGFHVGDRAKPWKYSKTPELILYLLLHPGGASQDLLMEQLFPEQPPNRPRLNQLVSDARTKALGQNDDGDYHLPHASPTEPFYKLLPSVGLDLRDFARHCANARKSDQIEIQKREWTAALELVGGRPFTLPHDGYEWAIPEIEATVVKVEEAAVALTDIAFELEDYQLAVWATKQGLLTETGYYELLVKRGRAALLLQDPEEIVRAFADLQVSLEFSGAPEEGLPDLSSHPDLEEVYNELSSEGRSKDRNP